jgi:hypothetical protein
MFIYSLITLEIMATQEKPGKSDFLRRLESDLSSVVDQPFRCGKCSHAYLIEGITLNQGNFTVKAYDLTRNIQGVVLTPECVETGLARTDSLTYDEAQRYVSHKFSGQRTVAA